jgi:small subunit ribosomal protein MRP21
MLDDGGQRKRSPSWATPQNNGTTLFRNTRLTGRAPTTNSSAPGGSGSLFNLPTQITSDMERATTTTTTDSTTARGIPMSTWNEEEFLPKHYDVTEPELRLRPSTGRTVHVRGNVDLARGFRLLHRAVTQNKIKRDERMARAYERPGLKRKRLKSERWAARFKYAFKSTIARAMELKGQGW